MIIFQDHLIGEYKCVGLIVDCCCNQAPSTLASFVNERKKKKNVYQWNVYFTIDQLIINNNNLFSCV